jgi:hypothetical protein
MLTLSENIMLRMELSREERGLRAPNLSGSAGDGFPALR